MKNQNGITLVALVITIIVLLILAGVSISLVMGNNGVLTQASNAVVKNEAATALSEVEMASSDAMTAYWAAWATNSTVKKGSYYTTAVFANNCTGAKNVWITAPSDRISGPVYVTYQANSNTYYTFSIEISNGKVTDTTETGVSSGAPTGAYTVSTLTQAKTAPAGS